MNELIDYTLIENEILKDSISDFLSEIREKSPEYFNSLGVKTVLHRGYAEVFVLLNKQVMMEHLVMSWLMCWASMFCMPSEIIKGRHIRLWLIPFLWKTKCMSFIWLHNNMVS